jgi:L-amino acid N-acyltransferase YncA
MTAPYAARPATLEDAPAIARIYNEGIDGRLATFETAHRTAEQVAEWFDGVHPIVVVTRGDLVVGFASTSAYRPRACYAAHRRVLGLRRRVVPRAGRRPPGDAPPRG